MDFHLPRAELLLAIFTLIVSLWYAVSRRSHLRRLPLPPGPKSDPLIGHLRKLPTSDEHRVYAQWSKELKSDIISMSVLGQTIIVLNSARAATDLLERRSAIYSSRAQLPMISDPNLVNWGKITGLLPYGERWRSQRRMTHASLHKKASTRFWPLIVKQSRLALNRLLKSPENYVREFRRMSGSTLLSAVYGYEVVSAHDPLVEVVENALNHLCEAAIPANFIVNTIPVLRYVPDWFPGTNWKQTVKEWRKEKDEMVDVPFNWTKKQIANGTASHSVLKGMLAQLENNPELPHGYPEEEDRIKWVTGTLFGGNVSTLCSAATTFVFIMAMVLYQDVFAKAQAEVDQVIGRDRLPEMDDRDSLPYVGCVLKEVLRWQPVVPLAIPHASIEEDEYRGYLIPKGATVIGNVWAIGYDESVYPEPERFNPDRFLDPETPDPPSFGFGRRSCPGIHMAESTLFITLTSLLSLFDIRPSKDQNGNEIIPVVDMKSNALVSYPAEFRCSITPRSEKTAQLLNAVALEAL